MLSQHTRRARHPTCIVSEWERDDKAGASNSDSCYAILAWWTWCDADESTYDLYWHLCADIDVSVKVFLLFYKPGKLRIVISTAKLMDHD